MKKFILNLCAKVLYKLGEKIQCDLNGNQKNDFYELADKIKSVAESL